MAHILVVDDDEPIRTLAHLVLSKAGHIVVSAGTAADALIIAAAHPDIDLVLLDLVIPGPDWTETLMSLRDILPQVPCVLSSGLRCTELDLPSSLSAHTSFLQKPYRADDLITVVNSALRKA